MIKNIFKKSISATLVLSTVLFSTSAITAFGAKTGAGEDKNSAFSIAKDALNSIYGGTKYIVINSCESLFGRGYKTFDTSKKLLKQIADESSDIKIYGQQNAKKQCLSVVQSALYDIENYNLNLFNDSVSLEKKGHVIYIIGPSGTGKTTLARAIANSILKNPKKTLLLINASEINSRYPLADQLFGTIGIKEIKNRLTSGIYEEEKESPVLKHLLNFKKSVVILDDYDKMKRLSRNDAGSEYCCDDNEDSFSYKKEDKSADEILRTISDTGKYKVAGNDIDASEVLFLVTTNESNKELHKNFGFDGAKGGGAQRLKIIEFEDLDMDSCKKIVLEVISKIKKRVTSYWGDFKIKKINIDDETIDSIAKSIFLNKEKQGRLKGDLEESFMNIFTDTIGEDKNKEFDITFIPSDNLNQLGKFIKTEKK